MIKHCTIFVLSLFLALVNPTLLTSNQEITAEVVAPKEVPHTARQKLEEEIPLPESLREPYKKEVPREDNFMKEFINMLMTLGALIALLLIVSWLFKRMANTRMQQINESSRIKVLERRSISAKSTLYLLDIKGKQVAIVESHNGLLLLPEVPADEIYTKE